MDFATIGGLIIGALLIGVTLILGGVPVQSLLQPEAILIVFGGTLMAVLVQFSMEEIHTAIVSFGRTLKKDVIDPNEVVDYIVDAAVFVRAKGLLALQPLLPEVEIPLMRKGLQLIIDNQPSEHIQALLQTELEVQYKHDHQLARIYEAAGGFAPTMGIIGAIVGLVQVMGMLSTPDQLGKEIASAFIATLYGVGSANLFFLPLAGKLKQRAKEDWFVKSIILQGLIAIREGQNPVLIREQLAAYLTIGQEDEVSQTEDSFDNLPQGGWQPAYESTGGYLS